MDIQLAIKTAYFQALSDQIGVPIYDAFAIPSDATYPYLIIASITDRERLPRGCRIYNVDVQLDVVTGFSAPTGMNQAWIISDEIKNIIWPNDFSDIDARPLGYVIGETVYAGSNPLQLRTNNYWIYRNIITFSHIVYPFPFVS